MECHSSINFLRAKNEHAQVQSEPRRTQKVRGFLQRAQTLKLQFAKLINKSRGSAIKSLCAQLACAPALSVCYYNMPACSTKQLLLSNRREFANRQAFINYMAEQQHEHFLQLFALADTLHWN